MGRPVTAAGTALSLGLALGLAACVHQTPTEVVYQPVDHASRTDLVALATRDLGFGRGELPALEPPVAVAFSWLRDTRAFPHRYGSEGYRTAVAERRLLAGTLEDRLSAPPFGPVSRIPAPASTPSLSPMAVPVMPLTSAARQAVLSARRLGAEILVIVQTRSEARLPRNLLAPMEPLDVTRRLLPGRDLVVDVQAEACALWARRAWLIHCTERDAREAVRWVSPLLREDTFAILRRRAVEAALARVADAMVDALQPLVVPLEPSPEEATAAPGPGAPPTSGDPSRLAPVSAAGPPAPAP
jgi:hypothetical protein